MDRPKSGSQKIDIVVLQRVSTKEQELERQAIARDRIMRHFGLGRVLDSARLEVSGTVVYKTADYQRVIGVLATPRCGGLVVPELDRWFRLKKVLISDWAKQLTAYVEPFEVPAADGKSAKLIYTSISASDGTREYVALNLRDTRHQDRLIEAVNYYTRERQTIANRFGDGKETARLNPEIKVDELPNGVEFVEYPGQLRVDPSTGRRKTRIKGWFRYTDYAYRVVVPIIQEFADGASKYALARKYAALHAELGPPPNRTAGEGRSTKNTGLKVHCVNNIVTNRWWLGIKHRVNKKERDWDTDLDRFVVTTTKRTDDTAIEVETNLAGWINPDRPFDPKIPREPLISRELWDKVHARLAEGRNQYEKRENHTEEYLARPLLRCAECEAIMYIKAGSKTDSRNKRKDVYLCRIRHLKGKTACDSPRFKTEEVDAAILEKLEKTLMNMKYIKDKIKEQQNEDQQAAAVAKVQAHRRTIAKYERGLGQLADAIFEAEDATETAALKAKQNEAAKVLAAARVDLTAAQGTLNTMPTFDPHLAALGIISDVVNMREKPVSEQREILRKYVSKIWMATNRKTQKWEPEFILRIPMPPSAPQSYGGPQLDSFNEPEPNGSGTPKRKRRAEVQSVPQRTNSNVRCSAYIEICTAMPTESKRLRLTALKVHR